jgi:hypothetical protein
LLIAIEKEETLVLSYLLGEDFTEIWGYSHLQMVLDVIYRERLYSYIGVVLSSLVAKNIFISLPEQRKYEFVRAILSQYGFSEEQLSGARSALA